MTSGYTRAVNDLMGEVDRMDDRNQSRMAVHWAASQLTALGRKLHHAGRLSWDVEHPNGSWSACNSVAELCEEARAALKGASK